MAISEESIAAEGFVNIDPMHWTTARLWLIGIGALAVVVATLAGAPDERSTRPPQGTATHLRARLVFAGQTAGGVSVAAGSIIVASSSFPALWFVVVSFAVLVAVADIAAALPLHRHWVEKRRWAGLIADRSSTDAAQKQLRVAQRRSTWRWCLLHPFSRADWPGLE